LSRHINIDKEDGVAWIQQRNSINNLKSLFGEEAMAIQGHGTSGTPRFKVVRPNDQDKIPIVSQSQYRFGVEMLSYLIKHSRPYLENLILELSK
jgi:hypothetical protein